MTKITFLNRDGIKPVKYVACGECFCTKSNGSLADCLFLAAQVKDKIYYINIEDGKPYYFDDEDIVEVVDILVNVTRKGEC